MVKRKVSGPSVPLTTVYERLKSQAPSGVVADEQDGVRLEWPARGEWVHVRPSGTEPIVRVIAEALQASRAHELADWAADLLAD